MEEGVRSGGRGLRGKKKGSEGEEGGGGWRRVEGGGDKVFYC